MYKRVDGGEPMFDTLVLFLSQNFRRLGGVNMKIYDWKKFLAFIAVLIFFIILILFISGKRERVINHVEEYVVTSGETLWSICTEYRPKDMSIQEYIYNIREYNKIGSIIHSGETIKLLIYEED